MTTIDDDMTTEPPMAEALNQGSTTVLTNSCLTMSGQLTFPGVYFTEFTQTKHSNNPVGAATADPDQLRWMR